MLFPPSRLVSILLLVGACTLPASAKGRNPGSVLIYPRHSAGGGVVSIVCVANTSLTPQPFDRSTLVHYQYHNVVAGADPFRPSGCSVFNRTEMLTPGDVYCVLTPCHDVPSVDGGYLIVSATDPWKYSAPWSFNHLVGSELMISSSGIAYSLNAFAISSPRPEGKLTDVNKNNRLDFDGVEYEGLPDVLYIDSFFAGEHSRLSLVNLTGAPMDVNTVLILVWNDNEFPLSTTLTFNCWFDEPLVKISTVFGSGYLEANTPHDPGELDLDCGPETRTVETGWAILDSIDVRTPGGNQVSSDGAMVGAFTTAVRQGAGGGRLLWESSQRQTNGRVWTP